MTSAPTSKPAFKNEYQIDVADHPSVGLWLKDLARKDPEGFLRLVGPNVTTFSRMWGKPDWTNNGEKGWTHGWAIYDSSMHWLVLTGPQGTIFRLRIPVPGETYLNDPKVGVGIIQYLSYLFHHIIQ